jgi:CheY-like chemotaxis protein
LADQSEIEAHDNKISTPTGGSETLLIAEDDPAIRTVCRHILQQFGYKLLEARDGQEAVDIYHTHSAEISLVILDMIMPGMNGREAYEAMQNRTPDLKALFISGYPVDSITIGTSLPKDAHFVQKPVSPMELLRHIRTILDGTE